MGALLIAVIIVVLTLVFYLLSISSTPNKPKRTSISKMMGMSYDFRDENEIMSKISDMSMEEVSRYADIVAKNSCKNIEFLKSQFAHLDKEPEFYKDSRAHNPTSLGNAAYLALNSPQPYAGKSKKMYDQLINFIGKNKSN